MKRVWMQTMVELGVTNKALVEHGLRAARATGFVRPPSAGTFCQWAWDAAQKSAGIPSLSEAQSIIIRRLGRPTMTLTGAMNHISMNLDWFEMRRASQQRVNDLVASAYDGMIKHWKAGRPFREPVISDDMGLEDNSHLLKPLTDEQRAKGRQEIHDLRASL